MNNLFLTEKEIERIICHLKIRLVVIEKHKKEIEADPELKLAMKTLVPHMKKAVSFWKNELAMTIEYENTNSQQGTLQ